MWASLAIPSAECGIGRGDRAALASEVQQAKAAKEAELRSAVAVIFRLQKELEAKDASEEKRASERRDLEAQLAYLLEQMDSWRERHLERERRALELLRQETLDRRAAEERLRAFGRVHGVNMDVWEASICNVAPFDKSDQPRELRSHVSWPCEL